MCITLIFMYYFNFIIQVESTQRNKEKKEKLTIIFLFYFILNKHMMMENFVTLVNIKYVSHFLFNFYCYDFIKLKNHFNDETLFYFKTKVIYKKLNNVFTFKENVI